MRSLVLLALIAFIPFPVRLLSDYHDQPAAVAIYMATFTAATTVQRLVWVYATGHPHLLSRPVPEELRRRYNLVLTTTPLGFGVLIPISLLAPRGGHRHLAAAAGRRGRRPPAPGRAPPAAVQAFRSPPSDSTLRDRRAWRRYGLIVLPTP